MMNKGERGMEIISKLKEGGGVVRDTHTREGHIPGVTTFCVGAGIQSTGRNHRANMYVYVIHS